MSRGAFFRGELEGWGSDESDPFCVDVGHESHGSLRPLSRVPLLYCYLASAAMMMIESVRLAPSLTP